MSASIKSKTNSNSNGVGKSLEEAIKLAKVTVKEDSERIVIERSSFASRKRARLSTVSMANDENYFDDSHHDRSSYSVDSSNTNSQVNSELLFWRNKYYKLVDSRNKELEESNKSLEDCLHRYANLEKYVSLLQKKVQAVSTNSLDSNSKSNSNDCKIDKDAAVLLHFYEQLTGTKVTVDNDVFTCTMKNYVKRLATRFQIEIVTDSADSSAENESGLRFKPLANSKVLPEYLRAELWCEKAMAPVLLADAIQAMFDDSR